MKLAFDKIEIKAMSLKNRFIRSATWEGMADESGRVTPKLIGLLTALAQGGVGLVVPGYAYVRPDGQTVPFQTGIYQDDLVPDLARLTQAIHQAGARTALQIVHGGLQASPKLTGVDTPAGPSALALPELKIKCRELSPAEISALVEDFGRAAARAKAAGFDALQLHAAHGFLFNQFLSPFFNRRGDRYGGKLGNRVRILCEAYEVVRGAVGDDFPVLIKVNSQDFFEGGLELEDSIQAAGILVDMGLDGVEVSGGTRWSGKLVASRTEIDAPEKEAYFRTAASAFKRKVRTCIILVGGLRSPQVIEEVLEKKQADAVSLCRPLIRQPDLVRRWAEEDLSPATCISCNGCSGAAMSGQGIYCVVEAREREKEQPAREA